MGSQELQPQCRICEQLVVDGCLVAEYGGVVAVAQIDVARLAPDGLAVGAVCIELELELVGTLECGAVVVDQAALLAQLGGSGEGRQGEGEGQQAQACAQTEPSQEGVGPDMGFSRGLCCRWKWRDWVSRCIRARVW